ncbi:LADA_0B02344g1_1 [Lachancea dasiensis]|uniref:LADA_0B02344g1_1 n=1 Tax=Lachancea dasiensis TaxID=1072105 RepID=A0A1G4ISM4_9SACH|nr:LADA_0B02344g1_1 [Lachancea dasiensis]
MSNEPSISQEIESLKAEIAELRTRHEDLETELFASNGGKNNNSNLPLRFDDLLDEFPIIKKRLDRNLTGGHMDSIPKTPTGSPAKIDRRLESQRLENLPSDISEPEWVLRTQPSVEHKMFDDSLADLLDMDILKSPSKRKKVTESRKELELLNRSRIENFYRGFGKSIFPVVDPSDLDRQQDGHASVKRQMLGLRLEIFNELTSKFDPPFYILFKRDLNDTCWELFKHTLPSYVGLEDLLESTRAHRLLTDISQIYTFANKAYMALLNVSIKLQVLQGLEYSGKISELEMDPACTLPSFTMPGVTTRFKLQVVDQDVTAYSCIPDTHKDWATTLLGPLGQLEARIDKLIKH